MKFGLSPPSPRLLNHIVRAALAEDVGPGDITTRAALPAASRIRARARIVARQRGVLAGLPVVRHVFRSLNRRVRFTALKQDGSGLYPGRAVAELHGPISAILAGERVALNFLARLSGIATLTSRFVRVAKPCRAIILDTRKTTPLLRDLEKYAVRAGQGHNHRFGLFDAVLIKDNHIAAAGSFVSAVAQARARLPRGEPIEVEAQNIKQVRQALALKAEIIMLDNMGLKDMRLAIRLIGSAARVEISGGVNLGNVAAYARLRPDYISVGGLTHSAPALDFSLDVTPLRAGAGFTPPPARKRP